VQDDKGCVNLTYKLLLWLNIRKRFNLWNCLISLSSVFDIVVAFVVVIWKKKLFCKKHGWFNIYICLVKTVVAIEVEQKVV